LAMAHLYLGIAYSDLSDNKSAMKEYEILKGLDEDMAKKLLEAINKETTQKNKQGNR